jgi:fermentation-respiration switch protein FrsA (DUF1100 family)
VASELKRVSFKNGTIDLAGHLHLPDGFDESRSYAAIVIATPGSSVKEQIGAIYAARLAAEGLVALVFDPSYQGESGGQPRDLENPSARVEDIRCAVDFLMTLAYIGEDRVGVLGICAGGGYAVNAALTEHRFKAVGTVVAANMGRAFREMQPIAQVIKTLEAVGRQRTAEARGADERRDGWIPDSLKEAEAAGITDRDVLDAVAFYRESGWRNDNSTNRLYFASFAPILGFDAFHLVPELLTQPLQIIVGGRRGITGSFEDGERLFELARNEKDLFVVEGAGHYDMYHKPEYVTQAIERLVPFYQEHLGA